MELKISFARYVHNKTHRGDCDTISVYKDDLVSRSMKIDLKWCSTDDTADDGEVRIEIQPDDIEREVNICKSLQHECTCLLHLQQPVMFTVESPNRCNCLDATTCFYSIERLANTMQEFGMPRLTSDFVAQLNARTIAFDYIETLLLRKRHLFNMKNDIKCNLDDYYDELSCLRDEIMRGIELPKLTNALNFSWLDLVNATKYAVDELYRLLLDQETPNGNGLK